MTMSRRPLVRTPRKRKAWADFITGTGLDGTTNQQSFDILDTYKTDMGVSSIAGTTCMRVLGHVRLLFKAAASTPAVDLVKLGICWADDSLAASTQPEPLAGGYREGQWLWQGCVWGSESGAGTYPESAAGS